jgi:type I restriction enzyme S subunit
MKNMLQLQFKNFITLQRGFDLPKKDRVLGDYPVVASTAINGYHAEHKVQPPGVVTGRSGSLGEVLYIDKPFWPLNTTLWVKDFIGNLPLYVYYFLKTLDLKQYNSGAGVPTLNRNHLETLEVAIHDFQSQRKIAATLSAYDDLIENNLRRIKILEEMAQNLYREWFVKFRFPGHEKVQMVDSPMGKIPEGWGVTTLDSVLSVLESGSRPKGGIDPSMRDVPSIGAENILGLGKYDFSKEKFVSREFFEKMKRGHINNCDVLLYKDGAKIGRKSMFRDNFPHSECCINEHVFILRTNEKCCQAYLFFWLDQPDITAGIINLNANAAQPGINQKGVKGLPILLPDRKFLDLFDEFVEPLLAKLFNLAKKNQVLRRTRDLLLPKLISGELDVSELEIKTGVS